MEVAHSGAESFSSGFRKKTALPLGQLVEETRKNADVPHHLLETKIFAKLQSNEVILAEPSVLHFGGFQLGKNYQQVLKLINVSSEVINIHVLPTQTKYFQTKYSKKYRLVPGLAYTVKVHFCPDEWRYFYDCIRVHCKGDENLLVPVHAYPIIDDLDVPPHISLPPVPLGQSVSRSIPLSCSCPIDFEFQVHLIQQHKAFTIQPLSGVIPANGKVGVMVTFTPFEYGTAQTTLQLLISQFNSKPYVCTLTGTSSPYLALSQQDRDEEQEFVPLKESLDPQSISLLHLSRTKRRLRPTRVPAEFTKENAQMGLKPVVNVTTPAGVAKMLIQQTDKMRSKDLREAMSHTRMGTQSRQIKEAFFENKVRRDIREERANTLRWQVHLGKDPVSAETRKKVLEEREKADLDCKVKREAGREGDFHQDQAQLSLRRVLRDAGQLPAYVPEFHAYPSSTLEVRQRTLTLFQQAARKVLIRCRTSNRLLSLRKLVQNMKRGFSSITCSADDEEPLPLKMSRDNLHPFSFPTYTPPVQVDEIAPQALGPVAVRPVQVQIKSHIPFFKLKVPQHWRLMGYQHVSAFEALGGFAPRTLARPLRTGAEDELLPSVIAPSSESGIPESESLEQTQLNQEVDLGETCVLSFSAPPGLLRAPHAHPLRIFNPAPGLHAFKQCPRYLECDPEFHLCPLPRYTVAKGSVVGVHAPSTQRKFLDRTEVIRGVMTWKKHQSAALSILASPATVTSTWVPRMSDPFNGDLLPATAPPPLHDLPEELRGDLLDGQSDSMGVTLTPEMLRVEFTLLESALPAQEKRKIGEDNRDVREQQLEQDLRPGPTNLGSRVQERLGEMKVLAETDFLRK
ncbi:cilia- and flagella-associated protein 221 [Megalops cyprinoides]|uniref:cilia- and flagella-associated protein 221 n=1 Tax=Megalops cyprinoides TaxID=118141 RepID=UPI001864C7C8|nr:cilia- and flagella-associated protein 221 [Megalops cyprinoides]